MIIRYDDLVRDLEENLPYIADPDTVIILNRGGLMPGSLVAHYFRVQSPQTIVLNWGRDEQDITALKQLNVQYNFEELQNILIVDDIYDSGSTAQSLNDAIMHLPNIAKNFISWYFCVEKFGAANKPITDLQGNKHIGRTVNVSRDEWILFPWETDLRGHLL